LIGGCPAVENSGDLYPETRPGCSGLVPVLDGTGKALYGLGLAPQTGPVPQNHEKSFRGRGPILPVDARSAMRNRQETGRVVAAPGGHALPFRRTRRRLGSDDAGCQRASAIATRPFGRLCQLLDALSSGLFPTGGVQTVICRSGCRVENERSLPKGHQVVVPAVAGQDPLHDPADRVRPPLNEQVKMVRHQAVGVKEEPQLLLRGR